jgi:hypothetical protein
VIGLFIGRLEVSVMSEWISVKDRAPEDGECVIGSGFLFGNSGLSRWIEPCVYAEGEFHPIAYDEERDICADFDGGMNTTTHWAPLPSAPIEVQP